MDKDTLKINIKTLKELVMDEDKLVTYISLSKELCIHVNEAKFLLCQLVDEFEKNNRKTDININFIISGLSGDNSARTLVCPEDDINAVRGTFNTIFFQHIYSISKGKISPGNAAFVLINKLDDFILCSGLVKGSNCMKRSSDEITNLKSNSQNIKDEPIQNNVAKKEVKNEDSKVVTKVQETKSEPIIKTTVLSPKKHVPISNGKSVNGKNNSKPKSIAGFFSKANSVPNIKKESIVKETTEEKTIKKEIEIVSEEVNSDVMDVDEDTNVQTVKEEPTSHSKDKTNKKNNSLSQIRKNAKVDKKRKRVLRVSDSESDNEKDDPFADEQPVNHESDDEIPPTPSANPVKITSGILNPKKRRKVVDKTYTDEDGYILTRKEEIYESCSENEEETNSNVKENVQQTNQIKLEVVSPPKDKKAKNSKKKISPPQKGKQATLTSFFKKV